MKKPLIFIFFVLFSLWVLVLSARSVQYVYRIVKEFKNPPPKLHQGVDPCSQEKNFKSVDEERLYNYLRLGAKCEKR